jgi:hypothetical protein
VNCEAIPRGPARTDCYLGLSQFHRGQSDFAAARARAQADAAWHRAITGQTLRNTNHIGHDKGPDKSRAVEEAEVWPRVGLSSARQEAFLFRIRRGREKKADKAFLFGICGNSIPQPLQECRIHVVH